MGQGHAKNVDHGIATINTATNVEQKLMIEQKIQSKLSRIRDHHEKQVSSAVIRCNECGRSYKTVKKTCVCGNSLDTATIVIHYRRPKNV
jgi:hypothetical protein